MRVVIIGAGVAGCQAAVTLRKISQDLEVVLIDSKREKGYSQFDLPYILEGEMDIKEIWPFNKDMLTSQGVIVKAGEKAISIDTKKKIVKTIMDGKEQEYNYDYLILTTGASPRRIEIKGVESYDTIKNPGDIERIERNIANKNKIAIIGGGFIGLEVAAALKRIGKEVVIIEAMPHLLPGILDEDMARIVEQYLKSLGIDIYYGKIREVSEGKIILENEISIPGVEHFIVSIGDIPNIELARSAGIKTRTGIIVDKYMKTSNKYVYAAGDCVEVLDHITKKPRRSVLANNAVREAIVAAYNIANKLGLAERREFKGIIGMGISRVGDLFIASAGISEEIAEKMNLDALAQKISTTIAPREYKNGIDTIHVKLIVDKKKRIIGGQVIGKGGVLTRINMIGMAIRNDLSLSDLVMLETAYNPVCTTTIDPIVKAAMVLERRLKNA
ncbi:FAD-dependent oxidoreductase [Candidatus Woesearchaeota archaeon]|nr:FAD-dependent oxidoreductase [Candidatus Woesearchaeota archaeon]